MTWEALAAWTVLAAVLTLTPGVDMALVARTALAHGRRPAMLTSLGICSGLFVWGAASAVGIAAALAASATAYDALRFAGAAYLVWLGARTLLHAGRAPEDNGPAPATTRSAYLVGLVNNIANPKIVVFYSTVMPGFIEPGSWVLGWSLLLAAIHAALGVLWLSTYAWMLDRARSLLARPSLRRALDWLTGTVLIGLGVRLALERR